MTLVESHNIEFVVPEGKKNMGRLNKRKLQLAIKLIVRPTYEAEKLVKQCYNFCLT